ncbi:MAG: DUF2027 domain-containing protein, partial [Tannerellaceae bacterium]|nr:DUF2027 domain-containing protein [Tannerellaceae bacterium]
MNIKIGDKVRFLNSVGGGIVRRFQGKDQVWVEGEDGFEVPVLARELVVVESLDKQTYTRTKPQATQAVETPRPAPEPEEKPAKETPEGERLHVFLAYLPLDPKAMTQSEYEAYFINDSNYYLFFNYMYRQNNSWISAGNGSIEPHTKLFLEEFGKDKLNDRERICVQLIAFKKDKPYLLKNALSVELRIDTVKFYKIHCFAENDFFEEDALIFPVIQADAPYRELLVSGTDMIRSMPRKPFREIIEIDLHIEQLLDDTTGLAPADILRYQLDKFHETLASCANRKGQKI